MEIISSEERLTRVCKILLKGIYQLQLEDCSQAASPLVVPTKTIVYSLTEGAKIIGISRRSLQRWVAQGKIIPHRKSNSYPEFKDEDLRKIIILNRNTACVPQKA